MGTEIQGAMEHVRATNLKVVNYQKEGPGVVCRWHQQTHRLI